MRKEAYTCYSSALLCIEGGLGRTQLLTCLLGAAGQQTCISTAPDIAIHILLPQCKYLFDTDLLLTAWVRWRWREERETGRYSQGTGIHKFCPSWNRLILDQADRPPTHLVLSWVEVPKSTQSRHLWFCGLLAAQNVEPNHFRKWILPVTSARGSSSQTLSDAKLNLENNTNVQHKQKTVLLLTVRKEATTFSPNNYPVLDK